MGALDILLGPTEVPKKKQKKQEEPPASTVATTPPPPSGKGKAKAKSEPQPSTQVGVSRPGATAPYPTAPNGVTLELPKPMSPYEIAEYMKVLGIMEDPEQQELPKFNINELLTRSDEIQRLAAGGMPIDVRPIAAYMDTVFGTNTYAKTPNQPAEFLAQMKQMKDLGGDSAALQQVRGQAALEEYKVLLDRSRGKRFKSLGEMAEVAKDISQIGSPGGANGYQLLKMALEGQFKTIERDDRNRRENAQIDREIQKEERDMSKEFQRDPAVTNYRVVRDGASRVRTAIYAPPNMKGGVPDYTLVIDFIRGLDPNSTVMYNEAAALAQAQSLKAQMEALYNKAFTGGNLGPQAKAQMAYLIDEYEQIAYRSYEGAKAFYRANASNGMNADRVTQPVEQQVNVRQRNFSLKITDPKTGAVRYKKIPEKDIPRAMEVFKDMNPEVQGVDH